MKKIVRISLFCTALAALLFVLLVASVFLVAPGRYQAYIEQALVQGARNAGISLNIGGSELSLRRYIAHNVKIGFPRKLLFFDLTSVEILPEYRTVFALNPRVRVNAKLYEGSMSLLGQYALRKGDGNGAVEIRDLKLSEHPQFAGFGIREGTLSADGKELHFDPQGLRTGDLRAALHGVEKPQATSFPLRSFGLPLDLQIPAFSELNLIAHTVVQRPDVEISEVKLTSSLGKLDARGKLALAPDGRPASWLIDGSAELTTAGLAALGQYLPLLSGGSIDEQTQRFRILIKGTPQAPTLRLSRF